MNDGGFNLSRNELSPGRFIGFARGLKMSTVSLEVGNPVLTAKRCVEVARPPSDVSCVINWVKEFGSEEWETFLIGISVKL